MRAFIELNLRAVIKLVEPAGLRTPASAVQSLAALVTPTTQFGDQLLAMC
jgi:hypothetical protein